MEAGRWGRFCAMRYLRSTMRSTVSDGMSTTCVYGFSGNVSGVPKKYCRICACCRAFMYAGSRSTHPSDRMTLSTCTESGAEPAVSALGVG